MRSSSKNVSRPVGGGTEEGGRGALRATQVVIAGHSQPSTRFPRVKQDEVPRIGTPGTQESVAETKTALTRKSQSQGAGACPQNREREPTRAGEGQRGTHTPRQVRRSNAPLPATREQCLLLNCTFTRPTQKESKGRRKPETTLGGHGAIP